MVRPINIDRADQLVWKVVKTTLHQIRDWPLGLNEAEETQTEGLDGSDGSLSESVTWMLPGQIDILQGEDRKTFLNSQIAAIHVYFDAGTAKHRLSVEFAEGIGRALAAKSGRQGDSWAFGDPVRGRAALSGPEDGQGLGFGPSDAPPGDACREIVRAGLFGDGGVTLRYRLLFGRSGWRTQ